MTIYFQQIGHELIDDSEWLSDHIVGLDLFQRGYASHLQQWRFQELRKGENHNSIIDAIEYYQSKIGDNRFQQLLSKITPSPKNILTLGLDQIKSAQVEFDEKYNAPSERSLKKQHRKDYTTTLVGS